MKQEHSNSPSLASTPSAPAPSDAVRQSPLNPTTTPSAPSTPGAPINAGHQKSGVRPMPQANYHQPQLAGQVPGAHYTVYQQPPGQGQPVPIQSRPPQYGPPGHHFYRPAGPPPPPKMNYKSVVVEFTSPLTPYGSSTSGHAGSGDRYLFPEYSILEWQSGGNVVVASFLLVRKVDPSAAFPLEVAPEATGGSQGKSKSSQKSKKASKDKEKGNKKDKDSSMQSSPKNKETATPSSSGSGLAQQNTGGGESSKAKENEPEKDKATTDVGNSTTTPTPGKKEDKQQKKKDEESSTSNLKEYYQPITIRIVSATSKVLEPLGRVVKPPEQVRQYMNEIMDRGERAPEGFLALRLPREGKNNKSHDHDDGEMATGQLQSAYSSSLDNKDNSSASRVKAATTVADAESDSGVENNPYNLNGSVENGADEEEEELKDFYGPPSSITPWY